MVRYGCVEGRRGYVVKVQSLLGHESRAAIQAYAYDSADDLRQTVNDMLS